MTVIFVAKLEISSFVMMHSEFEENENCIPMSERIDSSIAD